MQYYPYSTIPVSGYMDYSASEHIGVLDYMTWTGGDPAPSSTYHPKYLANVLYNQRMNAASLELSIGNSIAQIARYASTNNLGSPEARIGVGYFFHLGTSGAADWWTAEERILEDITVNKNLVCSMCIADVMTVYSGHFHDRQSWINFNGIINNSTSGFLHQNTYLASMIGLDEYEDLGDGWYFNRGNFGVTRNLAFFDDTILSTSGVVAWNNSQNIYNLCNLYAHDINLTPDYMISGTFYTFDPNGISEKSVSGYATNELFVISDPSAGHMHDAGVLSTPELVGESFLSPVVYDGNYAYAIIPNSIARIDTKSTGTTWEKYRNVHFTVTRNARIEVNGSDYAIFDNETMILLGEDVTRWTTPQPLRGGILNGRCVYYELGQNHITVLNEGNIDIPEGSVGRDNTEAYRLGNRVFFIMGQNSERPILSYDGISVKIHEPTFNNTTSAGRWNRSEIISSCVWNGMIMILTSRWELFTFNGKTLAYVGKLPVDYQQTIRRIHGCEGTFFIEYVSEHKVSLMSFFIDSSMITAADTPLLTTTDVTVNSIVYQTNTHLIMQLGNQSRSILRGKSSTLNFDGYEGILVLPSGSIVANAAMNTSTTIITGLTETTFQDTQRKTAKIGDERYLLEPGHSDDPTIAYHYPANLSTYYIDNYLYNAEVAKTYNDITCSYIFDNRYYYGHRGSITSYRKNQEGRFVDANTADLYGKIIVKFLSMTDSLFALVQDFTACTFGVGTNLSDTLRDININHIPQYPTEWGIPATKLLTKQKNANVWNEVTSISDIYGNTLVDCEIYNDCIYVLYHTATNGVACCKHDYADWQTREWTSYSGGLTLNEELYISATSGYTNAYHHFYMYNASCVGPYIVHDRYENLPEYYGPSGIYATYTYGQITGYELDVSGVPYHTYHVLDVSLPYATETGIRQPIAQMILQQETESNIASMRDNATTLGRYIQKFDRRQTRFITSAAAHNAIYILVQNQAKKLCIYKIHHKSNIQLESTSNLYTGLNEQQFFTGAKWSYFGEKLYYAEHSELAYEGYYYYSTFNPYAFRCAQIDLNKSLHIQSSLYVLGDDDDLFIQDKNNYYKDHRRYATTSSATVNGILYIPLTCRESYPDGLLHNVLLLIYADGTCRLCGTSIASEFVLRPAGRSHVFADRDQIIFSAVKLDDSEPTYKTLNETLQDPILSAIFEGINVAELSLNERLGNTYNNFGKKRWIIANKKATMTDVMNQMER